MIDAGQLCLETRDLIASTRKVELDGGTWTHEVDDWPPCGTSWVWG